MENVLQDSRVNKKSSLSANLSLNSTIIRRFMESNLTKITTIFNSLELWQREIQSLSSQQNMNNATLVSP